MGRQGKIGNDVALYRNTGAMTSVLDADDSTITWRRGAAAISDAGWALFLKSHLPEGFTQATIVELDHGETVYEIELRNPDPEACIGIVHGETFACVETWETTDTEATIIISIFS